MPLEATLALQNAILAYWVRFVTDDYKQLKVSAEPNKSSENMLASFHWTFCFSARQTD